MIHIFFASSFKLSHGTSMPIRTKFFLSGSKVNSLSELLLKLSIHKTNPSSLFRHVYTHTNVVLFYSLTLKIYIYPTFLAIAWKLVSYLWIMNRRFYVPSKSISFRVPPERMFKAGHKNRLSEYYCPAGAYQVNERIMSTQRSACPGGKLVAKLSDRRAQFRVSQSLRALSDEVRGASDTKQHGPG